MRFNFFSTVAAVWPCCCCCCTAADYQRNAPWKNTTRNNSRDYSPSSPRPSCSPDPSVKIGEARVNYPDTVFIRLLSKETPQPVEPIRGFFFPPQNGSRAVGSLAVQRLSVSAEGTGGASGPSLFPLRTPESSPALFSVGDPGSSW